MPYELYDRYGLFPRSKKEKVLLGLGGLAAVAVSVWFIFLFSGMALNWLPVEPGCAAVESQRPASGQKAPATHLRPRYAFGESHGAAWDDAQAVSWFRQAAEQGFADARNQLGEMYLAGRGVRRDLAQALICFRRAADQGHAPAQNNVGFIYTYGLGVRRNDAEAIFWFRKAADQGFAPAGDHLRRLVGANDGNRGRGPALRRGL
jgi:TPR repeat protein